MPATKTEIANLALAHFGDKRITDFATDKGTRAEAARDFWNQARGYTFASHEWAFATRYAKLARTVTTPTVRYKYEYQLPSDLAKISVVSDNFYLDPVLDDWAQSGDALSSDKLLADAEDVYLEYILEIPETGIWPAHFIDCMAVKLASYMSQKVTGSVGSRRSLETQFKERLGVSRAIDSQNKPTKKFFRSDWTRKR